MALIDFGRVAGRAALVRQRCGFFDVEPPYSTVKINKICFPEIHVMPWALPHGVLEMTEAGIGRRVLYYNKNVSAAEQRVGIAHGIHHHLTDLRNPTDYDRRECNQGANDAGLPQPMIERACDLFAGELLVPFDKLDEYAPDQLFPTEPVLMDAFDAELDRLASRFHVPRWFMEGRLRDLELLRLSSLSV